MTSNSQEVSIETPSQVVNIIDRCEQGPPGAAGTGIIQLQYDGLVALDNAIVDQVALADNWAADWLVTVIDTNGDSRSSKVSAIHNNSVVKYRRYASGGDPIAFGVSVEISGLNMVLRVTNHHNTSLDVRIARYGVET